MTSSSPIDTSVNIETFSAPVFAGRAEFINFFTPENPFFSDNLTPSITDVVLDEENLLKEVSSFDKQDLATLKNAITSPIKAKQSEPTGVKRHRASGGTPVNRSRNNGAFSRIFYSDDPNFRESLRTKRNYIGFHLDYLPEKERPSLSDFLRMEKFKQKEDIDPSPIEIIKIATELWQGGRVMLTDSAVKQLLRPKHTYSTKERIYCPFCLSTRKVGISLVNHFSESHRIFSKKCSCGEIISKKDKKTHFLTCKMNREFPLDEEWSEFIEQSSAKQRNFREKCHESSLEN